MHLDVQVDVIHEHDSGVVVVMRDAEDNEFCLVQITSRGRERGIECHVHEALSLLRRCWAVQPQKTDQQMASR